MNIQEADILRSLVNEPFLNQRVLAETSGHSLGVVNRSLNRLIEEGYLSEGIKLTDKAKAEIADKAPQNAIILAAGFGMRMVPINTSIPKAFLEVDGERLIDRLIIQLHESGITDITVVVGFMKDRFEYLMDKYGVDLVYNPSYATHNNLYSLSLVANRIHNTYILPCDIWCEFNPFRRTELYSWYMVSDLIDEESTVRVTRKMELMTVPDNASGNGMIGISYLIQPEAGVVRNKLKEMGNDTYRNSFWERTLYHKDRMIVQARVEKSSDIVEINTYEQLRDLDSGSCYLKSDAIKTIADVLNCDEQDIVDISVLKKGMTNRSFLFDCLDDKYIMRIPGEGTDALIDRQNEAEVYKVIAGKQLCDNPVYLNPSTGYKITRYIHNVRTCDIYNSDDLKACMQKLRSFHEMRLQVNHTFDLFNTITYYESLWNGENSVYSDYSETKRNVFSLREYIEKHRLPYSLTHIDAVPDNFLFDPNETGELALQLTDWEYAGMQDPHVDIAMFCIYSLYNRRQIDWLISLYFNGEPDSATKVKIYCYIAVCGLLWSNWCEYKRSLGVEFGEYSLRQYRYAKDYFKLASEKMGDIKE